MNLERTIDDQATESAFWLLGTYDEGCGLETLAELCSDVSQRLRTLAITLLVAEGKSDGFYHNLIRSAQLTERCYRRLASTSDAPEYLRSSGRYLVLMDAVAASDFDLATRVSRLMLQGFLDGQEYEDDFYYSQAVQSLVLGDEEACRNALAGFESAAEGGDNARLSVVRSLAAQDQEEFKRAFEMLIVERENQIAADIARGQFENLHVIAARRVFIEGLALLRLAERLGLRTEEEYLFCPSLARIPMTQSLPAALSPVE